MTLAGEVRAQQVIRGRNRVLLDLARGSSLQQVLRRLTESAEDCFPELRCSVLLLDDQQRLRHGAAASLPEFYVKAIDGTRIGPAIGSCGAAASLGRRVIVRDVLNHPNWTSFRDLARRVGFRACWSEPIKATDGTVLGTFAMYYDEPREPDDTELEFISATAHLAGIAIERTRAEARLRMHEERFRQVTESIGEVFYLAEWMDGSQRGRLLYVSPAYETIWGRSRRSLYEDPASWSYDIHPEDRALAVERFGKAAARGEYDVEYRLVRPDGNLCWIHDRAFPIRDKDGRVYRIAGISEDITHRKQVEEDLRAALERIEALRRSQVESLASDLLLAEERERRRLAVDLHDGLNQTITLAWLKLDQLHATAPEGLRDSIREITELVGIANQSARSLTFQLSPPILHDLGFEPALQWLVEDVARTYGLEVSLEGPEDPSPLSDRLRTLLFRAVRELLINVAKHAGAHRTRVLLVRSESEIRITVEDDGQAFDPAAVGSRGLGLSGIRERLSHLGGLMDIASEPDHGTRVTLVAPREAGEDAS
jgi:PAS domain S-box-containing protein